LLVPSWRFRAALQRYGLDPTPYAEHIAALRERYDSRLYKRSPPISVGQRERDRYRLELYSVARKHAQMRRDVLAAENHIWRAKAFPRNAVCRLPGGWCAYQGPCAADMAPSEIDGYELRVSSGWHRNPPEEAVPQLGF